MFRHIVNSIVELILKYIKQVTEFRIKNATI